MAREQIEAKLKEVFENALNHDGINYPVQITLESGLKLEGFKILENLPGVIYGLTTDERMESVQDQEIYKVTVVRKDKITKLICPNLDFIG